MPESISSKWKSSGLRRLPADAPSFLLRLSSPTLQDPADGRRTTALDPVEPGPTRASLRVRAPHSGSGEASRATRALRSAAEHHSAPSPTRDPWEGGPVPGHRPRTPFGRVSGKGLPATPRPSAGPRPRHPAAPRLDSRCPGDSSSWTCGAPRVRDGRLERALSAWRRQESVGAVRPIESFSKTSLFFYDSLDFRPDIIKTFLAEGEKEIFVQTSKRILMKGRKSEEKIRNGVEHDVKPE